MAPHSTRALMVQGTGSDVGKSVLVAGLCRAFTRRGLRVRPFKPQNMSNNAAATPEGGEIGRAQALQALACGIAPHTDMNPVLLKPETDRRAQVVVQGRVLATRDARAYAELRPRLLPAVLESFERIGQGADLVLVEGAGSPAEINLRDRDIANMGFALASGVPVVLAGDIERGGVIASLVGTHALLTPEERALVRGFVINKFRGDVRLFDGGLSAIEERTGWPGLGVVPYLSRLRRLPAEDSLAADWLARPGSDQIRVAVPVFSRIANFDDLDPLAAEPGVGVQLVPPGVPLPGDADLVVLPGSKASLCDLEFLRAQGWDIDLAAHHRRGGWILGICAGYQMLGRELHDPARIEGGPARAQGLGYLELSTELHPEKIVGLVAGVERRSGLPLRGYEIHCGRMSGPALARPWLELESGPEGAVAADQRVFGTSVHGLFQADAFRSAWIERLRPGSRAALRFEAELEAALDELADTLESVLDLDRVLAIATT
jgi:adenosylcobyric acid synthase